MPKLAAPAERDRLSVCADLQESTWGDMDSECWSDPESDEEAYGGPCNFRLDTAESDEEAYGGPCNFRLNTADPRSATFQPGVATSSLQRPRAPLARHAPSPRRALRGDSVTPPVSRPGPPTCAAS